MHLLFYAEITNSINAPTEFFLLLPESKQTNLGFDSFATCQMFDSGTYKTNVVKFQNSQPTKIKIYPTGILTSGTTTTISGQLTFEIA
jgi:hypothetical protein